MLCDLNICLHCFQAVNSEHGLLTTVAYKLGKTKSVCYALEVGFTVLVSTYFLKDDVYLKVACKCKHSSLNNLYLFFKIKKKPNSIKARSSMD